MTVFAVIAARAGSKGLPGKNLLPLGGAPLIVWSVAAARRATTLTDCWVSTDGDEIAAAAKAAGGTVPFRRPTELAGDDASIVEVVRHALREYEKGARRADVVVLLQATTPLRTGAHIDAAVQAVLDGADSAQTVALDEHHPLHKFRLENGRLKPVFTDEKASRRQDAAPIYRPNGGVFAVRAALLRDKASLYGDDHRGIVMDFESSVDIDTIWDFKLAEAIVAETKRKP